MKPRLIAALIITTSIFLFATWISTSAASGDVDPSFDATITTQFGATFVDAVVVQPDGKILIGGFFDAVNGIERQGLARLNPDGSLDTTFTPPLVTPVVKSIALQADGKILVGGTFGININGLQPTRMIVRLNADGSLDTTFSLVPSQTQDSVSSILIEPSGNILIGGRFFFISNTQTNGLARLNPNGTLNTALGFAGTLSNSSAGILDVKTIALQTDGKIVAGGEFLTPNVPIISNLARLNPNGTLDLSFNNTGTNASVYTVAVQTDGKILAAGAFSFVNNITRARIARLGTDGSVDAAFAPAINGAEIRSLVLQADGKILIGGVTNTISGQTRRNLARLNSDGSLDPFYPTGTPGGANGGVLTIAQQSDNKVLIGGEFTNVGVVARSYVARLVSSQENSSPNAVDDAAATNEDTPVNVNVLANDTDPDGDAISVSSFTQPVNGTVTNNGNGTLKYVPPLNYNGIATFTYSISDGNGGTDTASVVINVASVNDAPVASNDNYVIAGSSSLTVPAPGGVLANDTDVDGDSLTAHLVTSPARGSLTLNADGSFTYTPTATFAGCDSFTYNASDGHGGISSNATVTITTSPTTADPLASFASAAKQDKSLVRSAAAPSWSRAASLANSRVFHTATLLQDGRVLVAGGSSNAVQSFFTGKAFLKTAEIYDPATRTWRRTGDLQTARGHHTATLLPNGKVLVAGGVTTNGVLIKTAEVFDPATGSWTSTRATLNVARAGHTATLLPPSPLGTSAKVIVVAGVGNGLSVLDSAEVYDVATGVWTRTTNLTARRWAHTATYLPNGKVLVAGGYSTNGAVLNTAELYDPATNTWSRTAGNLITARGHHTASLLQDGKKVLFVGGLGSRGVLKTTELYDPLSDTFSGTSGRLNTGRWLHSATLLRSGQVLIAGGNGDNSFGLFVTNTAEVYSPATDVWTNTGNLTSGRHSQSATLLFDNKVLAAGGMRLASTLNTTELYDSLDARRVVSSCAGVTITATHGEGFYGNSRIARIENGRVPCMNSETGELSECLFSTSGASAGLMWVEAADGQYAKTGQAITLQGAPGGEWIVAARVNSDGKAPCVAPLDPNVALQIWQSIVDAKGALVFPNDTLGTVTPGEELNSSCVVEDMGQEYNNVAALDGWTQLINYATLEVCTSSNPHPDRPYPTLTRIINSCPGPVYCYRETGAALNDLNGTERDEFTNYYTEGRFCHVLQNGGYEVPAAKRPATRSLPAPGSINVNTPILWRPVNPNVRIAN